LQRDGHPKMNGDASEAAFTQHNKLFTILVVEGTGAFEAFLEDFLKSEGHFVLRAVTAAEALYMTRHHWPDLILLNREMEGSNGMEFLPELLMAHPSAAIVMMATTPSVPEAVEAMNQGAVNYLERPLDRIRLKAAIDLQKSFHTLLS
jgi:DNA-binding NtrC family response regulator